VSVHKRCVLWVFLSPMGRGRLLLTPAYGWTLTMKLTTLFVAAVLSLAPPTAWALEWPTIQPLIERYLWGDFSISAEARRALEAQNDLRALSRTDFEHLDGFLRGLRPPFPAIDVDTDTHRFVVAMPDGRELPTQVITPPDYTPERAWPLILAMHGGPNRNQGDAGAGAIHMAELWRQTAADAGWLLVTPAMTHVITRGPRTETRLPYEIMTATQMEALLGEVSARYNVDPNGIVATGVSLGANFSIAYAAARPDRFSGIAPVSSEGDAREHLIRNLALVASYSLQGGLDRNVRDRGGPRILAGIQRRLDHDVIYEEFQDRGHEAFAQAYPETLDWLARRSRDPYPREVWRVPHDGIMPIAKRIHWLEVDNHQALVKARIETKNRIVLTAYRTQQITLYLHDNLVDLDFPLEIIVNGVSTAYDSLTRSALFALKQRRSLRDAARVYATMIVLGVPDSQPSLDAGRDLQTSIEPLANDGVLSYWEGFAVQSLKDRFPSLGLEGIPQPLPISLHATAERIAIRLTAVDPEGPFAGTGLRPGDLLLSLNDEELFVGNQLDTLYAWLLRDLTSANQRYRVRVWRDGTIIEYQLDLALSAFH
jgi:predicted esterase